ncbi:hypothetical protein VTG60DRAFT_3625 [Thermothelomyces hinnuleus]
MSRGHRIPCADPRLRRLPASPEQPVGRTDPTPTHPLRLANLDLDRRLHVHNSTPSRTPPTDLPVRTTAHRQQPQHHHYYR